MQPAPTKALDDLVIVHMNFQNMIDADAGGRQGFSLRYGAGKTIKQKAIAAIVHGDAFFDQTDNQFIRH